MFARNHRLVSACVVGAAFIAIALMTLVFHRVTPPQNVADRPTPTAEPTQSPTPAPTPPPGPRKHNTCLALADAVNDSYTKQAQSRGAFGPSAVTQGGTEAAAVKELVLRLCGRKGHGPDRRLFAGITAAVSRDYLDPNRLLTKQHWVTGVNSFVNELRRAPAHLGSLPKGTAGRTMFMTTRDGRDPLVGVTELPASQAHLLIVKIKGGVLKLKLECGFQPVFVTEPPPWASLPRQ